MLNHAPIFVNGFQRGGTNILVNLISSHPNVDWIAETHMVFYGDDWDSRFRKWMDRVFYLPILVGTRQHIFWINKVGERNPVPKLLWPYVDMLLYRKHLRTLDEGRSISMNGETTRPLFKNVNAMTLNTKLFAEMYPDATFIALMRNGLALCEGFMRRGWSVERFAEMYNQVCREMIEDAEQLPNYHIVRFEDLLASPETVLPQIYAAAGLEFHRDQRFRLQAKKSMDKDGKRRYMFGGDEDREIHWFELKQLRGQFRTDVNDNQIARLSEQDRLDCQARIGEYMQHFGYREPLSIQAI